MPSRQNFGLVDIPAELLLQIFTQLHTARSVRNLSLTCRFLYRFARDEGWRAFTLARFASLEIPDSITNYREAAHGLTTLSRNWDRKSLLSRYIEPERRIFNGVNGKNVESWRPSSGQTMGYLPFIDSYEELINGDWSSRRQVVTWCAGAELLLRIQLTGKKAKDLYDRSGPTSQKHEFDDQLQWSKWFTWKPPESAEGRDDISTVNLIKPSYFPDEPSGTEHVLIGTASGSLALVHAPVDLQVPFTCTKFDTGGLRVRCADVSPAISKLIASCSATSDVTVFPLTSVASPSNSSIKPIDKFTIETDKSQCQIRSAKFLSASRLAVSLGPTSEPIKVYEVTPYGINRTPLKKMTPTSSDWNLYDMLDGSSFTGGFSTSVYPILPLSEHSLAANSPGNVFFSGCYFGAIRLHDLRSPRLFEMAFQDTNDCAVYCIQNIGHERIVAGYSRYSTIRVFDVRIPNGSCYSYANLHGFDASGSGKRFNATRVKHGFYRNPGSYNIFLVPQGSVRSGASSSSNTHVNRRQAQRTSASPVYSISSPSSISPVIFTGVENRVMQIDLTNCSDPHPDLIYQNTVRNRSEDPHPCASKLWNPLKRVLNLAMYEPPKLGEEKKGSSSRSHRLLKQAEVGSIGSLIDGLDERWIDARDF